jgi:hypothetical protein
MKKKNTTHQASADVDHGALEVAPLGSDVRVGLEVLDQVGGEPHERRVGDRHAQEERVVVEKAEQLLLASERGLADLETMAV